MSRARFTEAQLASLRDLGFGDVVRRLGMFAKRDLAFEPVKSAATERWHVTVDHGGVVEVVLTWPKWHEPASGAGGGGAIDLGMHLTGLPFARLVRRLLQAGGS